MYKQRTAGCILSKVLLLYSTGAGSTFQLHSTCCIVRVELTMNFAI